MEFPQYARAVVRRWSGHDVALVLLEETPSTHLLARRIAREYGDENAEAPRADVLAWRQTAGRGRGGRRWSSPAGAGVYATVLRPLAAVGLQTLPLQVAIALCEALNVHLDGRCRLKWPNDLLVEGRKLGGVLIDAASRGQGYVTAVISFGVNHARELDVPGATSVERWAPGAVALVDLAAQLVAAVDVALSRPESAAEAIERYRELTLHRVGEAMRCRVGGDELEGIFEGFDEHGFLRLRVAGEERLVTAGEVDGHG